MKLNTYIWESKFTSRKQNLFGLLFPRNVTKIHTCQSKAHVFYFVLKETIHKPSKVAVGKAFLRVYVIGKTGFNELFLCHVIPCSWKTFFHKSLPLLSHSFQTPCCRFLVLKVVRILYTISTIALLC